MSKGESMRKILAILWKIVDWFCGLWDWICGLWEE